MKIYQRLLVGLLVSVLGIGLAYAAFSQAKLISDTTDTKDLSVIIASGTRLISQTGSSGATITRNDSKTVTVSVPTLEYLGASAVFEVVLENDKYLDARVSSIVIDNDNTDLNITYSGITNSTVITAGDTLTTYLTVEWDVDSTSFTGSTFTVTYNFEQDV